MYWLHPNCLRKLYVACVNSWAYMGVLEAPHKCVNHNSVQMCSQNLTAWTAMFSVLDPFTIYRYRHSQYVSIFLYLKNNSLFMTLTETGHSRSYDFYLLFLFQSHWSESCISHLFIYLKTLTIPGQEVVFLWNKQLFSYLLKYFPLINLIL